MNNKTAQQVSERNRFSLSFTGNEDICKCQQNNFFGQCVCVFQLFNCTRMLKRLLKFKVPVMGIVFWQGKYWISYRPKMS
jgi:hypothetical protein